jgi:hypothetical protein
MHDRYGFIAFSLADGTTVQARPLAGPNFPIVLEIREQDYVALIDANSMAREFPHWYSVLKID